MLWAGFGVQISFWIAFVFRFSARHDVAVIGASGFICEGLRCGMFNIFTES